MIGALIRGQMTIELFSKGQQVFDAKRRAARRRRDESVGRQHIGQISRKRSLCAGVVKVKDTIATPRKSALEQLVAGPVERVKRMSYCEPTTLIRRIRCS
jgi:hypothetical protein